MRIRLTPREDSYYAMFTTQAEKLVVGARLLGEMLGADMPERAAIGQRMRQAEHDCDEATHAILRQLNSSFVTPFDREDIYRLASLLDDVMDLMEAAADLVVLYRVDKLPDGVAEQVEVLSRAADLTVDVMPRLRTRRRLEEYWIEINRLENQADQVFRRLVAELFNGDRDALEVLKLKEVIEQLEAAADAFEHVAHTIETIVVKES